VFVWIHVKENHSFVQIIYMIGGAKDDFMPHVHLLVFNTDLQHSDVVSIAAQCQLLGLRD
jgi:hypothetical protein